MDLNNTKFFNNTIIKFILIFTTICTSGHVIQTLNFSYQIWVYLSAIIVCIPVFNEYSNKKLNVCNSALLIFSVMIFSTMIVNLGSGRYTYILMLFTIFVAYGITYIYGFEKIIPVYLNIMTVVSAISLLGHFFANNTAMLEFLPSVENINGVEYKTAYIFSYIAELPERNCGMFWEPGLFATHLAFSFVLEIVFKSNRTSFIRILLFTAAMITTNSSAGFVLLILCWGLILVKERKASPTKPFWQIMSIIAFVLLIMVVLNMDSIIENSSLANNEYVAKLLSENVEEQSRIKAISHNLSQFARNPLFGIGFTEAWANIKHVADTSTTTFLLSVFGFLGGFYTIFWIYGIFKMRDINIFTKILLVSIIMSIINKEPHQTILFTWVLMFCFLKKAQSSN